MSQRSQTSSTFAKTVSSTTLHVFSAVLSVEAKIGGSGKAFTEGRPFENRVATVNVPYTFNLTHS